MEGYSNPEGEIAALQETAVQSRTCRSRAERRDEAAESWNLAQSALACFEICAGALALRLTKRMASTKADLKKNTVASLEKRLENLRRQAERLAIKANEPFEVELEKAYWQMFCDWIRANVLFHGPDTRLFKVREYAAEQRAACRQ